MLLRCKRTSAGFLPCRLEYLKSAGCDARLMYVSPSTLEHVGEIRNPSSQYSSVAPPPRVQHVWASCASMCSFFRTPRPVLSCQETLFLRPRLLVADAAVLCVKQR
eukprot:2541028-Pleurochrysis_carterae.AAC.2